MEKVAVWKAVLHGWAGMYGVIVSESVGGGWLDFLMAWERRMVMFDTRMVAIGLRDCGILMGLEGLRRLEGLFKDSIVVG